MLANFLNLVEWMLTELGKEVDLEEATRPVNSGAGKGGFEKMIGAKAKCVTD